MELLNKTVIAVKIDALKYKNGHPNDINVGYTTIGELEHLEVGDYMFINNGFNSWLRTSVVTKIEIFNTEEEGLYYLVHTRNSIYKVKEFSYVHGKDK